MKRTVNKEQFFTDPMLAKKCVQQVGEIYSLASFSLIVEPSAGDGIFLKLLPKQSRVGIDIAPQSPEIIKSDFLAWFPPLVDGRVLTIGNPPFGQRAALAVKFINRACEYSDVVAFILPRSFNKYTFQDRVDPFFELKFSMNCDELFTVQEGEVSVKTVFQIWERSQKRRTPHAKKMEHSDFEMRHAHLSRTTPADIRLLRREYEFAIPQVGANFHPRDPRDINKGSYWFIKPAKKIVRKRFEKLNFDYLDDMNTAHKSLSKSDIIAAYEVVVAAEKKSKI